jgi:hypothetical protein
VNKKLLVKTTGALLAATTAFGVGAPAAFAQEGGGDGVVSGNGINIDIDIPVWLCGVGVALFGDSYSDCYPAGPAQPPEGQGTRQAGIREAATDPVSTSSATTTPAPAPGPSGSGDGVVSGNGINLDADVPVAVCAPAVAVAGDADSYCDPAAIPQSVGGSGAAPSGSGDGVVSGNGIDADIDIPVWACALGIAIFGDAWGDCS